ncbi:MAG: MaoC family dehydratase [Actinomycetota bacterium]|nr:MaoC family dehydratase [Actinomycetota bacterium]
MTIAELERASERDLGETSWTRIDQQKIDLFADATEDHQWIHVDPEAAARGPFGTTVAHGYLTLSLLPRLMSELLTVTDSRMGINYGTDRVRFTAPVPSGSEIRLRARLRSTERRGEGLLCRVGVEVEIRGHEKPALVGEVLSLLYG